MRINKNLKRLIILIIVLIVAYFSKGTDDVDFFDSSPTETKVIRVLDGDTIEVQQGNTKEKVRLIGVDTPETKHPNKPVQYYGKEASNFTTSKLLGKTVYLEYDVTPKDKYGRSLAYVWLTPVKSDKRNMFNSILIMEGYAQVSTVPPNVKYVEYFKTYQKEARDKNKGLWDK